MVFKSFHDMSPAYIKTLIEPSVTYAHLRSDNDLFTLKLIIPNSKYGERSFSCMAPIEWNLLPQDIRLCSSIGNFKSQLKSHYMSQCYE